MWARPSHLIVGLILAVVPFAGAAITDTPFLALFPELKNLPAPDWVQPGVRLTYTAGAAAAPVDPEAPGAGGAGYTQIDVVSVTDKQVVLRMTSWGMPANRGPCHPIGAASYVGPAGVGTDWYLNPQVLKRALKLDADGLTVAHMPYKVHGKTYDAMRFEWEHADGKRVWVYDYKTGVLLHSGFDNDTGAAKLSAYGDLMSIRTLKAPWATAAVPDWVGEYKGLHYQGRYTLSVPGDRSYGSTLRMDMQVLDRGATWQRLKRHTERGAIVQGLPADVDDTVMVTGRAVFGGLWIPPKGLQTLEDGQVLDTDPHTGIETRVEAVADGAGGERVVRIVERNRIYSSTFTYQLKTGLLAAARLSFDASHTVFEMELSGRE